MTDFLVKAVPFDGINWPIRAMPQSLDNKEMGDAEWWRRMAVLQNAAARTGDANLLASLDNKRKNRWNVVFDAPEVVSTNNLPQLSVEECIKRWFQGLDESEQQQILKESMAKMLKVTDENGKKLFSKKQHWMAAYLVLRDRLGMNLHQNHFHKFAEMITPEMCSAQLRINSSTMTNFSKIVPSGMYFKLSKKENPFYAQCNSLWSIVKNLYYSVFSTNE